MERTTCRRTTSAAEWRDDMMDSAEARGTDEVFMSIDDITN
jgi:hypothetical protein